MEAVKNFAFLLIIGSFHIGAGMFALHEWQTAPPPHHWLAAPLAIAVSAGLVYLGVEVAKEINRIRGE